jgi:hypothetical protein
MPHKFQIGDVVEFQPAKSTILRFRVVRHMPVEFPSSDWKYKIKSDAEDCERVVSECNLSPSLVTACASMEQRQTPRRRGRHH